MAKLLNLQHAELWDSTCSLDDNEISASSLTHGLSASPGSAERSLGNFLTTDRRFPESRLVIDDVVASRERG